MKRFWDKVAIKGKDACWEWQASDRGMGYGAFKFEGKVIDAHRFSFTLENGEIPSGYFVCHKCDNRKCVNPNHLFLGLPKANVRDMIKKQRNFDPVSHGLGFKKGHKPKNRKLTDKQVKEIRKRFDAEKVSKYQLGREYQVDEKTIRLLLKRETYTNI